MQSVTSPVHSPSEQGSRPASPAQQATTTHAATPLPTDSVEHASPSSPASEARQSNIAIAGSHAYDAAIQNSSTPAATTASIRLSTLRLLQPLMPQTASAKAEIFEKLLNKPDTIVDTYTHDEHLSSSRELLLNLDNHGLNDFKSVIDAKVAENPGSEHLRGIKGMTYYQLASRGLGDKHLNFRTAWDVHTVDWRKADSGIGVIQHTPDPAEAKEILAHIVSLAETTPNHGHAGSLNVSRTQVGTAHNSFATRDDIPLPEKLGSLVLAGITHREAPRIQRQVQEFQKLKNHHPEQVNAYVGEQLADPTLHEREKLFLEKFR